MSFSPEGLYTYSQRPTESRPCHPFDPIPLDERASLHHL
jgi:hypothetical protein